MFNKKRNMDDWRKFYIQLALIFGIMVLASQGKDGWGWLIFALLLTL